MLRIGVLGAARIAPAAVIRPAAACPDASVVAVAARDVSKARAFAVKHGIPVVHESYQDLLDDPGVDAVYNPLPNGLHGRWTLAALAAGKHVLCEKPFAANAVEAATVAAAAHASGLVVMEALHYRYHPMARRAVQIVRSGELGAIERVEAAMCFPLPRFADIRYDLALAGGALMDAGCYPVHLVRSLGGAEPRVLSARATLHRPNVDRAMTAEVRFDEGYTAGITCSMWSRSVLRLSAKVYGTDGVLSLLNPYMPQMFSRMTVASGGRRRVERTSRRPTYAYQLDAFVAAVAGDEPVLTPPADSVRNMALIDAIYTAAGLQPRVPT